MRLRSVDTRRLETGFIQRSVNSRLPTNNIFCLHYRSSGIDSPAFLHYHLLPGIPEVAGELHIWLTSSSDPITLDEGADLFQREGMWRIPLIDLARFP
jgi:hypothetical protein